MTMAIRMHIQVMVQTKHKSQHNKQPIFIKEHGERRLVDKEFGWN